LKASTGTILRLDPDLSGVILPLEIRITLLVAGRGAVQYLGRYSVITVLKDADYRDPGECGNRPQIVPVLERRKRDV
jgi:hypothetical protein